MRERDMRNKGMEVLTFMLWFYLKDSWSPYQEIQINGLGENQTSFYVYGRAMEVKGKSLEMFKLEFDEGKWKVILHRKLGDIYVEDYWQEHIPDLEAVFSLLGFEINYLPL